MAVGLFLALVGPVPRVGATPPTTEWVWHKTEDGLHPSGEEQQMVWLMNRARRDPAREGRWLADTGNPGVEAAIDYFNVDLELLRSEFDAIDPAMPCAFDRRLHLAASQHAEYLVSLGSSVTNPHVGQQEFIDASGFQSLLLGNFLSVFLTVPSGLYAHCGFNIDWYPGGPGGMFPPDRPHRRTLMSSWTSYPIAISNCGIALVPRPGGRFCCSANYTIASGTAVEHANYFILGTVYDDADKNGRYDPGEGLNNVRVQPDRGHWHAVTGAAGGYSIPAEVATYKLTFSGGELPFPSITVKVEADDSVLRDVEVGRDLPVAVGTADIALAPPNGVRLSWETEAGIRYDVEESTDLRDWSAREEGIDGTGGVVSRDYAASEMAGTYLRVFAWRP